MTKRKLFKLIRRLKHIPAASILWPYILNKIKMIFLRMIKSGKVAYPSAIMVELTNLCNLKCITCPREYEYGKQMDKGSMDFENFKKIIDETYPYLDSIGLSGLGESFLYKDLIPAVNYIQKKNSGIRISLSINLQLDTSPEIVQALLNKVDTIQISIDGLDEVYDKIRIGGNFKRFKENLRKIVDIAKSSETELMFYVVVLKENYKQMVDIIQFAREEGIKYVNFTPVNLVSITGTDASYYRFFNSDEFKKELNKVVEVSKRNDDMEITFPNFSRINEFTMCRFVLDYFNITWDGFIPPCCTKPFPKVLHFGNAFEDGVSNTLNSKEYQEFRKVLLNKKVPEFCLKCFYVVGDRAV